MKLGQTIREYRIVSKPGNANAGKCLWAFAERAGEQFFVKEFLDPKRPRPDSMGTPEDKLERFAECLEFERRHRSVIERIRPDDLQAGNLVLAVDFFAEGSRYYKVTPRITGIEAVAAHDLPTAERAVLIGTLVDSLRLLHRLSIVHGDLKPENILLHRRSSGGLRVAKLIDFDDAYVDGDPPAFDVIGGDARYAAPEWLTYLRGATDAAAMTTAVDVFAFALVVHVYLTGALPGCDAASPAEAVMAGRPLTWDPRVNPDLQDLLAAMTGLDPATRPRLDDCAGQLESASTLALRPTTRRASRVRINTTGRTLAKGHPK